MLHVFVSGKALLNVYCFFDSNRNLHEGKGAKTGNFTLEYPSALFLKRNETMGPYCFRV